MSLIKRKSTAATELQRSTPKVKVPRRVSWDSMKSAKPIQNVQMVQQIRGRQDLFRGTDESLWNFYRDGVTSSFLNSFLTCMEQTRLIYCEGWKSRTTPLPMEFGICIHWILEHAYAPETMQELAANPSQEEVSEWVKVQLLEYEQIWKQDNDSPTTKQTQQMELIMGLAEVIIPIYLQRWDGDFNGGSYSITNPTTAITSWTSLEEVFRIPYKFPSGYTKQPEVVNIDLRGRRDGVFRDAQNKLWNFDTKCRSIVQDSDLDTLPLDIQQMVYLLITKLQFNEYPAGVIMNIVRRPQHRQNSDSLPVFLERVKDSISDPKKFDHNFIRYQMSITPSELDFWEHHVFVPILQAVHLWWKGELPHYLNHNALVSKYGLSSMYLPIVKNDFSMCFKRNKVFSELE